MVEAPGRKLDIGKGPNAYLPDSKQIEFCPTIKPKATVTDKVKVKSSLGPGLFFQWVYTMMGPPSYRRCKLDVVLKTYLPNLSAR